MNADRIKAVNEQLRNHKRRLGQVLIDNNRMWRVNKFEHLLPLIEKMAKEDREEIIALKEQNLELNRQVTELSDTLNQIEEKGIAEYIKILANS